MTRRVRCGGRYSPAGSLVVAVALIAVAGCSQSTATLDRAATEQAVEKVVGSRIGPRIQRVRCPEGIARKEGERFTCQALLAGDLGDVRLEVIQTDADADLDVNLLDAVIERPEVAEDLRRSLVKEYLRTFTVDCGTPKVTVIAPGGTFTCTVEDATTTRQVSVTVTDAAGTLTYDIGS